jgi:hypothetical protein
VSEDLKASETKTSAQIRRHGDEDLPLQEDSETKTFAPTRPGDEDLCVKKTQR